MCERVRLGSMRRGSSGGVTERFGLCVTVIVRVWVYIFIWLHYHPPLLLPFPNPTISLILLHLYTYTHVFLYSGLTNMGASTQVSFLGHCVMLMVSDHHASPRNPPRDISPGPWGRATCPHVQHVPPHVAGDNSS